MPAIPIHWAIETCSSLPILEAMQNITTHGVLWLNIICHTMQLLFTLLMNLILIIIYLRQKTIQLISTVSHNCSHTQQTKLAAHTVTLTYSLSGETFPRIINFGAVSTSMTSWRVSVLVHSTDLSYASRSTGPSVSQLLTSLMHRTQRPVGLTIHSTHSSEILPVTIVLAIH